MMKRINRIKNKLGFLDLREEAAKWVKKNLGEEQGMKSTTSIDGIRLNELKAAVHKADILARPNVIICNPKDEEKLKNALDDMNVFLIRPYEAVEQGKTYVINRYKLEEELVKSIMSGDEEG